MKFIDVAKVKIIAGKGGDGSVAFHRELYVDKGGPSGGDGGNGGSIIVVGKSGMTTLLELKFQKEIKGLVGENGSKKKMHGKNAVDKKIFVPLGTLIINEETKEIVCDVTEPDQEFVIAKGGKGGRGNARFATSRNKAPTIFEAGQYGDSFNAIFELKVLADVGLIGLPNAGKSTLLSKITSARPKIANYPFTTLTPHLGVATVNKETFVLADLPGLIEGASVGKGLGISFLRHIERCRLLVHVIDMSGNYGTEDVYENYLQIRKELKGYNINLENRTELIVANKMDVDISLENLKKFKKQIKHNNVIEISGLMGQNLDLLKSTILKTLVKLKSEKNLWEINENKHEDFKHYTLTDNDDEIIVTNKGNGVWEVSGQAVQKIYNRYPISTYDNLLIFNKKLHSLDLFKTLANKGAKVGDMIKIFDYELEWDGEW